MKKIIFLAIILIIIIITGILLISFYKEKQPDQKMSPAEQRANWKNVLNWPDECDYVDPLFLEQSGIKQYQINEQESLILVLCFRAAYQDNYRVYYLHNSEVQPIKLKTLYQGVNEQIQEYFVESFASIDPNNDFATKGNKLYILSKGAGHFGCGYYAQYEWNNSSKEYELIKFKAHFDCDSPLSHEEWPIIYSH